MGKAHDTLYPSEFQLSGGAGLSVVQLGQIPMYYKENKRSLLK